MRRVAVFSDTHGNLRMLDCALEHAGKIDLVLHLGDYARDAQRIGERTGAPFLAVSGNNDYDSDYPVKLLVEVERAKLLLAHSERMFTRGLLMEEAIEKDCAALLTGHTHMPNLEAQGKLLLVNPGSFSFPRGCSEPSFAILEIDGEDVYVRMKSDSDWAKKY